MSNKQEYKIFFKTLASRMRALLNLQENVEGKEYDDCVIRLSELEKIKDMMMVSFSKESTDFNFEKANEYFGKLIKFDIKGDK